MFNSLLERIEVDVIIDFQGGGRRESICSIALIAAAVCDSAVAFCRLEMSSLRGRRRKRLASVVARSAAATARTYSR